MERKFYQDLAGTIGARINCEKSGNTEWFDRHSDRLEHFQKCYLPSGGGIDSGTKIDLDKSTDEKIVLTFGYHHMNEGGFYDGWTEHTAIITPSLQFGFNLKITGRDRNQIKEYLADTFHHVLNETVK
jgi:hypothetical protein